MNRRDFIKLGAACAVGVPAGLRAAEEAEAPSVGEFDLVVAGGSTTGVCAAVTAARAGLKVALVEYNAFFGGMATAGLVPIWHTFYSTDNKTKLIGGLTEEIVNRLLARGEAQAIAADGGPYRGYYFNAAAMQIVLDDLVTEAKTVVPFLKAHVVGAEKDREGHLTAAVIEDKSGRRVLRAKWFVDATGDADLTVRAGFETWSFPRPQIQGHTLCAIFANVPEIRKRHPKFSFCEVMKAGFREGRLGHVFQWGAPVIGAPGLEFLAATRVTDCCPSEAADLTRGLLDSRAQLKTIIDIANRDYPMPAGHGLALVSVGSDLGIRESRHIKAKYRVTQKDILYGRHFDDCIGRGTYCVDIHEGAGITFKYLDGRENRMEVTSTGEIVWKNARWRTDAGPYPTWYEIPLAALVPEKAENLICAGRMIDCDRDAYGALRVMVNCNQMGEAAGRVAVKGVRG